MIELFQTEWCPSSRRIRQRLTELGIDYVIHQVPVEKVDRVALLARTGCDVIPALVLADGTVLVGEETIRRSLDEGVAEPPGAEAHRAKAARARRRDLEEAAAERRCDTSLTTPTLEVVR
jgi:glutathione S-transferase